MGKSNQELINSFNEQVTKKHVGKINIVKKSESKLMKVLSKVLFFNRGFMSDYITTLGNTIYVPDGFIDRTWPYYIIEILAHEVVHVIQSKRSKFHGIAYVFPQILASLALLASFAFLSIHMLWFLLFLLFLLPIPAPFREQKELEAYTVGFIMAKYAHQNPTLKTNEHVEFVVRVLTGPDYYFCTQDERQLRNKLRKIKISVENDEIFTENEYFKDLYKFLHANGMIIPQKVSL